MKRWIPVVLILAFIPLLSWVDQEAPQTISRETSLIAFKAMMGLDTPSHYLTTEDSARVEIGKQLINVGRADTHEGKSAYISRFYVCTSCHNTVREQDDLSKVDPDARLDFAMANRIPFLQASTFWGIVNREVWYNDDYVKKYGDLVVEANKSLEASIQLCAQECSQGRELEDWELESILQYLRTLEIKIGDLQPSDAELAELNSSSRSNMDKLAWLNAKYLPRSPATFTEPPAEKHSGYRIQGDELRGKAIYELGCQHCHSEDGVSDLVLDDSKKTFKWLKKHISSDSRYSIYEIVRHGTYAEYGHREYMPLYTQEKMSDKQVEDLRAYIESQAD